jgi:hypothetical protein
MTHNKLPPLPEPGLGLFVGNNRIGYTEDQMRSYGDLSFESGYATATMQFPAEALRQSQSLPAGAVASVISDIRAHCNPPNPESDDEVSASYALSWADRLEQAIQAGAREKGEAVVTEAMVEAGRKGFGEEHGGFRVCPVKMRAALVAALATQPAQASEKDNAREVPEVLGYIGAQTADSLRAGYAVTTTITRHVAMLDDVPIAALATSSQENASE